MLATVTPAWVLMQPPNQTPDDWDAPPPKQPPQKLVVRGMALVCGALLLLGAFIGFFFVVVCSNLVGSGGSYGMANAKAYQMLLASLSASALGMLLVEYGAIAVKSRWRLMLSIGSALLLAVSLPWY